MTTLFIGNISRDVKEQDLLDEFDKIAPCTIRFKVRLKDVI
jgi:hypothetical protein